MNTPFLHEALAQHFSLDDLRLLCVTARVDPDSVPFAERGKEIYAYCIVETFRKKDQLTVLIAACARLRDHVDWSACRVATTVPPEWAGLFAAQRALDALHNLPSPPENFVGRQKEIDQLCAAIRANANTGIPSAIISSVQGMGGIGKTALALIVAYQLKPDFPDAQFFIELKANGSQPLKPSDARDQVLRAFYPEAKLPDDETELANLYRTALTDERALLIFDDARDAAQIKALLPPAGCAVIITSRQKLAIGEQLRLESLPRADSITVLRKYRPTLTDVDADAIADQCADLPIALTIAGSFLKEYDAVAPAAYCNKLRSARIVTLANTETSVAQVFATSYDALTPELRTVLQSLSIMPTNFDAAAAAAVAEFAVDAVPSPLADLVRLSLIEYDAAKERYRWHDLLRDFVAGQTPAAPLQAASFRHAQHYTQVAYETNNLYLAGNAGTVQGLNLFDRERLHLNAAFAFLSDPDPSGDAATFTDTLIHLVDAVAYVGALRFHPRERIRWLNAQLAASRLIGDRNGEGNALGNLGIAYRQLSQPARAVELYEQQLVITREIGDRMGEGAALGNLGLAYADLGQPARAIELYEQHLVIAREIGDRMGEGAAVGNLGVAYRKLGQPARAIELYEQHLVIAREIGDRRGEGNALGNLGNAYYVLGQPARAIEYHEQTLISAREIGDRRGEGADLGNLGLAYAALGQPARAVELYEQQLVITREIGDRRGEGNALGNLGTAYAALGQPARAIELYEQQLVITREIGDRRGAAMTSWNLGLRYEAEGNLSRAIELMQVYVDYLREIGHPDAENRAAYVDELRARLAGHPPAPSP